MGRVYAHLLYTLLLSAFVALPASAQYLGWYTSIGTRGEVGEGGSFRFGAMPFTKDGYDGQTPRNLSGLQGAFVHGYRQNGPGWAGPTGFYWEDYEAPIPAGGSKTWWDIYLWAQGYTHSSQTATVTIPYSIAALVPRALLVLDYVPDSIGWTGPIEYEIDMSVGAFLQLPITTVTDPLQGTRMHFTVYAPIPEPTSLVALATGVVGSFALVRRDISDTLPGVAIAISLVPPLAVVGLTLESGAPDQARGALLLFITNVAAILATGVIVMALFGVHRFGPEQGTLYRPSAIAARSAVSRAWARCSAVCRATMIRTSRPGISPRQ